jgi:hypothetical protein
MENGRAFVLIGSEHVKDKQGASYNTRFKPRFKSKSTVLEQLDEPDKPPPAEFTSVAAGRSKIVVCSARESTG